MLLILALLIGLSPALYCNAQNEQPEVVGSEVKVLPSSSEGEPSNTEPPSPGFSDGTENPPESSPVPGESSEPPISTESPAAESKSEQPPSETSAAPQDDQSSSTVSSASPVVEFELNITSGEPNNGSAPVEGASPSDAAPSSKEPVESTSTQDPFFVSSVSSVSSDVSSGILSQGENETSSEPSINSTTEPAPELNSTNEFLLPSRISRIRVTVIGFTGKPVRTFNLSGDQVLYQMKSFWLEPESWQDIGWNPSDRYYELFCWLATNGGFERDLYRGNVSGSLITYSQWYALPETEDQTKRNVSVHCGIRPVNAGGKGGEWVFGDPTNVRESPVFLRGFENVNVNGWTREEVVRFVKNQKRLDSPQTANKAQAKAKGKSRAGS